MSHANPPPNVQNAEMVHATAGRVSGPGWVAIAIAVSLAGALLVALFSSHAVDEALSARVPTLWSAIPFGGLLLCIALLPLVPSAHHWWENNLHKLFAAMCLSLVTLGYYAAAYDMTKVLHVLEHAILAEYVPFMVVLFALFSISGGVCLKGDLAAHPATNTALLAVGGLIASFIGTTGASMLLIRPLLQTNSNRKHVVHTVVFFIILVCNVGGTLLPIGDPPLFLGYLMGVPFLWTLTLWKEWAFALAVLLPLYFIWDTLAYRRETRRDIQRDETQIQPLRMTGLLNFVWLFGVVLSAALIKPGEGLLGSGFRPFPYMRELVMLGFSALSLRLTPRQIRIDNQFNYTAVWEVAALFAGIFICMQAPIEILRHSGATLQPYLHSPARFFWATGILSSFLDNAPTYVVFLETAASMSHESASNLVPLLGKRVVTEPELVAISIGAVFMGANTYIGNGPNFMVRSIAEQSGIRMPSFFGYMLYSGGILLPVFLVITLLFL
jgi:Na+/H+ antiporter NhaD/arsenite permease-like protein